MVDKKKPARKGPKKLALKKATLADLSAPGGAKGGARATRYKSCNCTRTNPGCPDDCGAIQAPGVIGVDL